MSHLELTMLAIIRSLGLPEPAQEFKLCASRRWRFDFAFPNEKIAIECEGGSWVNGRHSRGDGFEKDCEKYNFAALHGWTVLRYTNDMSRTADDLREAFGL